MKIIVILGFVLIVTILIPFLASGIKEEAKEIRNSLAIKLFKKLLFLTVIIGGGLYLGIILSESSSDSDYQSSQISKCTEQADFYWDSSLGMCVPDSEKPLPADDYDSNNNSSESEKPVLRAKSHVEAELNKRLSKEEYDKKLAEQIAADEAAAKKEDKERAEYYADEEKRSACYSMGYSWDGREGDKPGHCYEEGIGSYYRPIKLEKDENGSWAEVEEEENNAGDY
ncbi:hypothetical protein [Peribacillus asahii]|uniref:hypothetical protein n=1 Tax=Peribacillus asahii TaxID=228899 RepID=UPI0037F360A8